MCLESAAALELEGLLTGGIAQHRCSGVRGKVAGAAMSAVPLWPGHSVSPR